MRQEKPPSGAVPTRHFVGSVRHSRGRLRLELVELRGKQFVEIHEMRQVHGRGWVRSKERLRVPLSDYKSLVAVVRWIPGLVRRATAETQAAIAARPDPEPDATADGRELADETSDRDATDSAELLARVQELKRAGLSRGEASVRAFGELAARMAARRFLPGDKTA